MPEHAQQARTRLRHQRFDGGGTGLLHGRDDSAALRQDVEVGFACHLHLEFVRTVPSPYDVRVRVYEARHQNTIARLECWFIRVGCFQLSRRTDREDLFIAHEHSAVFDDSERTKSMSTLGTA